MPCPTIEDDSCTGIKISGIKIVTLLHLARGPNAKTGLLESDPGRHHRVCPWLGWNWQTQIIISSASPDPSNESLLGRYGED